VPTQLNPEQMDTGTDVDDIVALIDILGGAGFPVLDGRNLTNVPSTANADYDKILTNRVAKVLATRAGNVVARR